MNIAGAPKEGKTDVPEMSPGSMEVRSTKSDSLLFTPGAELQQQQQQQGSPREDTVDRISTNNMVVPRAAASTDRMVLAAGTDSVMPSAPGRAEGFSHQEPLNPEVEPAQDPIVQTQAVAAKDGALDCPATPGIFTSRGSTSQPCDPSSTSAQQTQGHAVREAGDVQRNITPTRPAEDRHAGSAHSGNAFPCKSRTQTIRGASRCKRHVCFADGSLPGVANKDKENVQPPDQKHLAESPQFGQTKRKGMHLSPRSSYGMSGCQRTQAASAEGGNPAALQASSLLSTGNLPASLSVQETSSLPFSWNTLPNGLDSPRNASSLGPVEQRFLTRWRQQQSEPRPRKRLRPETTTFRRRTPLTTPQAPRKRKRQLVPSPEGRRMLLEAASSHDVARAAPVHAAHAHNDDDLEQCRSDAWVSKRRRLPNSQDTCSEQRPSSLQVVKRYRPIDAELRHNRPDVAAATALPSKVRRTWEDPMATARIPGLEQPSALLSDCLARSLSQHLPQTTVPRLGAQSTAIEQRQQQQQHRQQRRCPQLQPQLQPQNHRPDASGAAAPGKISEVWQLSNQRSHIVDQGASNARVGREQLQQQRLPLHQPQLTHLPGGAGAAPRRIQAGSEGPRAAPRRILEDYQASKKRPHSVEGTSGARVQLEHHTPPRTIWRQPEPLLQSQRTHQPGAAGAAPRRRLSEVCQVSRERPCSVDGASSASSKLELRRKRADLALHRCGHASSELAQELHRQLDALAAKNQQNQ